MKPTNYSTVIKGPGLSPASPSPSIYLTEAGARRILHRLLGNIRQRRRRRNIDDRGFAKEKTLLEECVVPSLPEADQQNRRPPKSKANKVEIRAARDHDGWA